MRITAIETQKRSPDRVNLHVDGAFRLSLAAEIALAEGLRTGDEISEARLAALEERDHAWKARQAAMNLLAVRARSTAELRRRLVEKGYSAETTESTLAWLDERGMLDDAAFAASFVRDRVRLRPHGKRRLQQELRRKGVDAAVSAGAIEEVLEAEEASEAELAVRAAAKWKPRAGEDAQAARRRLYGYLARRGFAGDAILAAMEHRLGGAPDPE